MSRTFRWTGSRSISASSGTLRRIPATPPSSVPSSAWPTVSSSTSSQKASKPRNSSSGCAPRIATKCRVIISVDRCPWASSWRSLSRRRHSCAAHEQTMKVAENCGTGSWWASVFQRIPVPAWIAAKLRDRPDCEHELALYRLAAGVLAGCYLLIAGSLEERGDHDLLRSIVGLFAAFELASLGIFCHLLWRPGASAARRLAGILLDFGALSYCMHVGGEMALPLYPLYLLAILANGFRFGTGYLLAGADVAVASFALVTGATEFFAAHPGLR